MAAPGRMPLTGMSASKATGTTATRCPGPEHRGIALVPPDAVALYRQAPHGSPRNVLTGRVTGLERSGALVSVRLELEEGQRLSAAVTAGAVAELGITEGREVCCVIKAVQVRILARRG